MTKYIAVGDNPAALQATIDAFRADLGGGNIAGPNGSYGGIRREIDLEDIPDANASPANFPIHYYNTTSPRGADFSNNTSTFIRISQDDNTGGDADPDLLRFSDIDPGFATQFQAFSGQRIGGVVGASDGFGVRMQMPGTTIPAVSRGAGIVLLGADMPIDNYGTATVRFYDQNSDYFAAIEVPPGKMAFIGITVPEARIAVMGVTLANTALDGGPETPGVTDIVAFDDIIYAEPQLAHSFLPEGASGFFDTDVALSNPTGIDQHVELKFLEENGTTTVVNKLVPKYARLTVPMKSVAGLESTIASTVVTPQEGLTLGVERTMFWGTNRYGGHTGNAITTGATRWYFAEGAQGFFDTFVLVTNQNDAPSTVTFTFLRENEAPFAAVREMAPHSRLTLYTGAFPELAGRAFGVIVDSTRPIAAERSMYFGSTQEQLWKGGHESPGVNEPWPNWYFSEGATGDYFDTFILLVNPQDVAIPVALTYLREAGAPITVNKVLAPKQRLTINLRFEAPELQFTNVATEVHAEGSIIAERSMYWKGNDGNPWTEAHNTFGLRFPAYSFLLSEGRTGGPEKFHTYILLANVDDTPRPVHLDFLRENGLPHVSKEIVVNANSRYTFDVTTEMPQLVDESFATYVRPGAFGSSFLVERSMYWDAGGAVWAGGTSGVPLITPQSIFIP